MIVSIDDNYYPNKQQKISIHLVVFNNTFIRVKKLRKQLKRQIFERKTKKN